VAAIKDAILSGAIEPGDQIVESRMAQQLGSGIPLVREALIALEHQGFVQKTPYKGTTATKLEPKQIREIFQLRVELEALAIEWAKENVTPADIKELKVLIEKMILIGIANFGFYQATPILRMCWSVWWSLCLLSL